jgi:K+-sensing histidine kinase KdpD
LTRKLIEPNFRADIDAVNSIEMMPTLLQVICRTTGMGFAAVARVTEDRWVTCSVRDEIAFGLKPGDELKVETTICHEIRQSGSPVVIDHVAEDEAYKGHHTPAMYGFQSYISIPIFLKDGKFFGTLCSIDPKPAKLKTPEVMGMFKLFADLISFHLGSMEDLRLTEAKLLEEQETAKLRERFIAILGHDLRNPVGAILNSAQLLLRMPIDDRTRRISGIILDSSYRMKGLIDNVLDFAQSNFGNGLKIHIDTDPPLTEILNHVIDEIKAATPDAEIDTDFNLSHAVDCDGRRIAQLFSNLLGNAVAYRLPGTPVKVHAESTDDKFMLSVTNAGKKIPEDVQLHIFQPFYRADQRSKKDGLGLGLHIASEIALAHHGKLEVSSTDTETCFCLTIPSKQAASPRR